MSNGLFLLPEYIRNHKWFFQAWVFKPDKSASLHKDVMCVHTKTCLQGELSKAVRFIDRQDKGYISTDAHNNSVYCSFVIDNNGCGSELMCSINHYAWNLTCISMITCMHPNLWLKKFCVWWTHDLET